MTDKTDKLFMEGVRMSASKTVCQIKVTLVGSKPMVWRRFPVDDTITLGKLHDILQIVMGWTNGHLHRFFTRCFC